MAGRPPEQEEVPKTCHHPKLSGPLETRLARLRSVAGFFRLEGGRVPSWKFLEERAERQM
ncbi:MAG: hypothetical protein HY690_07610 [Chloroflexi bacterium]|nr:hypothetical protein [Chloroflexota bacterium]